MFLSLVVLPPVVYGKAPVPCTLHDFYASRKKETSIMPILSVKVAQGMKIPPPGPKEYWEDSEWAYEHMNEISDWCVT